MACNHAFACGECNENRKRLAREWQDSILRHEQKRDEEYRMREKLERHIEELERALQSSGKAGSDG